MAEQMILDFDTEPEEWRQMVGYEGRYEVSSHGRVRRCGSDHVLAQQLDGNDRPTIRINRDGKKRTERVHQMVAAAFIGPRPDGLVVCHRDDDNQNNYWRNLLYDTQLGNIQQRNDRGRTAKGGGTHAKAKLTPDQVREIRRLKPTLSYYKLASMYGVSHTAIEALIKGKSWSHVK
jgi:hypothetical protein